MVKPKANKVSFAMTVKKNLHFYQVDMIAPVLNSHFGEKLYIEQPLYFGNSNKNHVLLLL